MRVLITNHRLSGRTGSELATRDLALGLQARGIATAIFTSQSGPLASELREAGIPVVDSPEATPFEPDVIHGQHNLETLIALTCFRRTPAVYAWQGEDPQHELPPTHSRIGRYASGIDPSSELIKSAGIDSSRYRRVPTPVDLSSAAADPFAWPRRRIRKAVLCAEIGPLREQLSAACEEEGIELDVERRQLLGEYELAFASGRLAIEALAAGCSVIATGPNGIGEAVTEDSYEAAKARNFLPDPARPAFDERALGVELACLRVNDTTALADRVGEDFNLENSVKAWIELYEEAIAEMPERVNARREQREVASFLKRLAVKGHEEEQRISAVFESLRELAHEWAKPKEAQSAEEADKAEVLKQALAEQLFRSGAPSAWRELEAEKEASIETPEAKVGFFTGIADRIATGGAQIALLGVKHLPLGFSTAMGRLSGQLGYWLRFRQRRMAIENLNKAFPDLDDRELRWLARESFRRRGENLAAGAWTHFLAQGEAKEMFEVVGARHVTNEAGELDRNVLLAIPRIGNTEFCVRTASKFGDAEAIRMTRPKKYPRLSKLVCEVRKKSGARFFDAENESVELGQQLLQPGQALGVIADRPPAAGADCVEVRFFKRLIKVSPDVAVLARRFGCPLHVVTCSRIKFGRWRYELSPAITLDDPKGRPLPNQVVMQDVFSLLEEAVERDPASWVWTEDRWVDSPVDSLSSQGH